MGCATPADPGDHRDLEGLVKQMLLPDLHRFTGPTAWHPLQSVLVTNRDFNPPQTHPRLPNLQNSQKEEKKIKKPEALQSCNAHDS